MGGSGQRPTDANQGPVSTLAGPLATAGILQAAIWLRRRLAKAARPGESVAAPGEIRITGDGGTWTLSADLPMVSTMAAWLLLDGPGGQQAHAATPGVRPLVFTLPAGSPGTYRFWLIPSRSRHHGTATLARRTAKALAAGEFRVEP